MFQFEPCSLEQYKSESLSAILPKALDEIDVNLEYLVYNVMFLKEAFQDLQKAMTAVRGVDETGGASNEDKEKVRGHRENFLKNELDNLAEEVPEAINDCLDGLRQLMRSAAGIRGLTEDRGRKRGLININEVIINLVLAFKQEWSFKSQLVMELDKNILPLQGVESDLHHALSKMIIYHMRLQDALRSGAHTGRGILSIKTKGEDGYNEIEIGSRLDNADANTDLSVFYAQWEKDLAFVKWIIVSEHEGEFEICNEPPRPYESRIRLPIY